MEFCMTEMSTVCSHRERVAHTHHSTLRNVSSLLLSIGCNEGLTGSLVGRLRTIWEPFSVKERALCGGLYVWHKHNDDSTMHLGFRKCGLCHTTLNTQMAYYIQARQYDVNTSGNISFTTAHLDSWSKVRLVSIGLLGLWKLRLVFTGRLIEKFKVGFSPFSFTVFISIDNGTGINSSRDLTVQGSSWIHNWRILDVHHYCRIYRLCLWWPWRLGRLKRTAI